MILLDHAYGRAPPFRAGQMQSGSLHKCATQPTMASAYSVAKATAQRLLSVVNVRVGPLPDWPLSLYHLDAWIDGAETGAPSCPRIGMALAS